jgi:hypothetical protein
MGATKWFGHTLVLPMLQSDAPERRIGPLQGLSYQGISSEVAASSQQFFRSTECDLVRRGRSPWNKRISRATDGSAVGGTMDFSGKHLPPFT